MANGANFSKSFSKVLEEEMSNNSEQEYVDKPLVSGLVVETLPLNQVDCNHLENI